MQESYRFRIMKFKTFKTFKDLVEPNLRPYLRPRKKKFWNPVTWPKKIGSVGREKIFF